MAIQPVFIRDISVIKVSTSTTATITIFIYIFIYMKTERSYTHEDCVHKI